MSKNYFSIYQTYKETLWGSIVFIGTFLCFWKSSFLRDNGVSSEWSFHLKFYRVDKHSYYYYYWIPAVLRDLFKFWRQFTGKQTCSNNLLKRCASVFFFYRLHLFLINLYLSPQRAAGLWVLSGCINAWLSFRSSLNVRTCRNIAGPTAAVRLWDQGWCLRRCSSVSGSRPSTLFESSPQTGQDLSAVWAVTAIWNYKIKHTET